MERDFIERQVDHQASRLGDEFRIRDSATEQPETAKYDGQPHACGRPSALTIYANTQPCVRLRRRDQRTSGCSDYKCSHYVTASADPRPDHITLSDLEPRFVCSACGKRGADIRPDFHWDKPGTLTMGY